MLLMSQKINGYVHYTQCFMSDPCERSRDQLHVAYPDNTNGYRWGFCRECDLGCICNRLVDMRNEGFENGLAAARYAVAALPPSPLPERWGVLTAMNFRGDVLAAIDALREKP